MAIKPYSSQPVACTFRTPLSSRRLATPFPCSFLPQHSKCVAGVSELHFPVSLDSITYSHPSSRITDVFQGCGHAYRLPDEMLQCDDRFCKFSTTHPDNCGPNCKTSCWQYRQFPEQIHRTFDRKCPSCLSAGR
ncbi:hypothetical protein BKA70DRAFT_21932 [Coprinopsis sp. MPI-PUGE-AT-0042]|nr:hypothetical protein BKA70DRAFT_21932 [Coprinopsis sp. MPI-PUGE-AT-0042]